MGKQDTKKDTKKQDAKQNTKKQDAKDTKKKAEKDTKKQDAKKSRFIQDLEVITTDAATSEYHAGCDDNDPDHKCMCHDDCPRDTCSKDPKCNACPACYKCPPPRVYSYPIGHVTSDDTIP